MDDHEYLTIDSIIKEGSNIELKYIKYWMKEAYQDNVLLADLIKWIEDNKNVNYSKHYHAYFMDLYAITYKTMKTKKNYRIKKEIKKEAKKEAKVDPRFQAMAEEIDFLKSEVQVLKKIYLEKNQ